MSKIIDTNTYTCQAVSGELIEKEGKEPSVGVKLRVIEGPHTGKDIYWYGSLSGAAAQYTLQGLRTMGWSCNDVTELEGLGSTKFILIGKAGSSKDGTKQFQNWMVFPVRTTRPALEADKKASFAERFKALAVETAKVTIADENKAGPLPEAATPANGKPVDGPATTGVQF